jgi:hypothetical protein
MTGMMPWGFVAWMDCWEVSGCRKKEGGREAREGYLFDGTRARNVNNHIRALSISKTQHFTRPIGASTVIDGVGSAQLTGDFQFVVRGAGRYNSGAEGCGELKPIVSNDT